LDLTQYIGPNSLDLGGGGALQYDSEKNSHQKVVHRESQLSHRQAKLEIFDGRRIHRQVYLSLENSGRYESLSNILFQVKGFRALLQYQVEPRYYFESEYLYTGYTRMGYEIGDRKFLDLFFATTSLKSDLHRPEVWRIGFEYSAEAF